MYFSRTLQALFTTTLGFVTKNLFFDLQLRFHGFQRYTACGVVSYFAALSLAWDQAPQWGKKGKNRVKQEKY